ncbi:Glutathione peroxidase family protein [Alkalibacterium sp. AK22]|uniref:glutathione peroxidase n=1 Tax=Alkalibacterium sp. AK22 TaxID=1229520 RepID=UPI0004458661|nr:glutathione peroxidase [Alkalibacterium sp. AK22]EXJ23446.1 Glutathione peroxidase family protein [Alkalibacterium sp. AK22]
MTTAYDFTVHSPKGEPVSLSQYEGKVLLIVNTASHCGFASQFDDLQQLQKNYKDQPFSVLGFPCGQFKHQEFDDMDQTIEFCQMNYNVTFPMFYKIDVNGPDTHPLYQFLKSQKKGLLSDNIKWNFTKFLVDQQGQVIKRYAPATNPLDIEKDIQRLLDL